ncbi:hypothetical protein MN116_003596 [Schistosoma mekongi]|uniref:Glypican n=1 Tax=Schistosoma mekongi TaxID=38744 RepID=A0AAE1ZEP6_SCHME|nr:hypothetical protein MN116_003596 [Schistosoma mekongi]
MISFEVMRIFRSILLIVTLLTPTYALDCTSFKQQWMKFRYTMLKGLQSSTVIDPTSNICPVTGTSCCDANMEGEMYLLGQRQLIKQCNSWLQVARKMSNHSAILESIFQADLQQAKGRLHESFIQIYGYNYKLYKDFFSGFFTDLGQYMAGQRGHLGVLIKNFFSQLRDSIVSLIERSEQVISNPPFGSVPSNAGLFGNNSPGIGGTDEASESRRIRCLSDKFSQLHPFKNVDVRLHARMIEAYPPARMLVNVLSVTSKLLHHLVNQVLARSQCILGITRYRFCALCGAQSLSNVCPDSCAQLLSSCLHGDGPDEAQLAYIWPQLIDTIVVATNRLERPFNFPAVNHNLHTEISDAITSLQERYNETKSKFESECRFGFVGRRMPTLFNPIGPTHNNQENFANLSDISRWPRISNPNRRLSRIARSSPVSQEFIDWQGRQRLSEAIPSNNRPLKIDYGQQMTSKTSHGWDVSHKKNPVNAPHDLVRQVNEIKQAYSSLRNMFSGPLGNFCQSNSTTMSRNENLSSGNISGHCWNPPNVPNTAPDPGVTQILAQLYEASRRLHEASSNAKDPDILVVQLPPRSKFDSGSTYSRGDQNTPLSSNVNDPLLPNQFLAQDQWQGPKQSRVYNSYELEGNIGIGSGSGNQPNTLQYPGDSLSPPYEQSSNQMNTFSGDPHNNNDPRMYGSLLNTDTKRTGISQSTRSNVYFDQKSSREWPQKPSSGYNNWDNVDNQRNKWESSGSTDLNVPIFQELTTELEPVVTETTTSTTTTTIATTSTTATTPTVLPTTTTRLITTSTVAEKSKDLSSSKVKGIPTESVTGHILSNSSTVSGLDKRLQATTQRYIVDETLKRGAHTESLLPSTDQPNNIGFLPDDEDNTRVISRQIPYQTPDSQNVNSWSQASQRPFDEGSGYQGSGNTPSELEPQYQGTWNISPDKPISGFLEHTSGISPSAEWGEDKSDRHTGLSQWQGALEGSGRSDTEVLRSPVPEDTPIMLSATQSTQPPPPSRVGNVPEVPPHPPLPPPEVWVPAKLSPGQPLPPILLIREYSVEGPLYGKEETASHPYSSASYLQPAPIFLPLIIVFIF